MWRNIHRWVCGIDQTTDTHTHTQTRMRRKTILDFVPGYTNESTAPTSSKRIDSFLSTSNPKSTRMMLVKNSIQLDDNAWNYDYEMGLIL